MEQMSTVPGRKRSGMPCIIMQPGPLHLFWTTGVFYLWSLRERFNLILVVPESFRGNPRFERLAELPEIQHIEYLSLATSLSSHRYYARRVRALLGQYRPSYVLLHNRSYPENQYLIHWARLICPHAPRYNYQNGRASLNLARDFAARRAVDVVDLMGRKLVFRLGEWGAGLYVDIRNLAAYFLNLKMLPLLAVGSTFSPPLNVFSGKISRGNTERHCNGIHDWQFAYIDIEIEKYRRQGIRNIAKVEHPLRQNVSEVFSYLDGATIEARTIFVVPSYGYTARLLESGWTAGRTIEYVADRWCDAIKALKEKFPGRPVRMKLHPASADDPVWQGIMKTMMEKLPGLEMLSPSASAELHSAQAGVVVGDVSSVLWWAALLGERIVISMDIFGYPGGDELSSYGEYIYYVNDITALPDRAKKHTDNNRPASIDAFFDTKSVPA